MDLENSIVPKIEYECPSTAEISELVLPAIKDWKVGERYLVKVELEAVSMNKGSMYDPNDDTQVRTQFRVLGAEALDANTPNERYVDVRKNRMTFTRALQALLDASREYD